MAEKTIKLNLNVDSKSGEASIKRTSGQIKALGATAAASSAAIGTGSKAAAGGILLMSASTIKAAGGTSKLGKETHKLITKMAGSKTAALKQANPNMSDADTAAIASGSVKVVQNPLTGETQLLNIKHHQHQCYR